MRKPSVCTHAVRMIQVRNAKEVCFKKHETSSYGLCFSKLMLQESWSRVCLHSTVRHLTVRDVSYSMNRWLPTRAVHLGSCSTFAWCPWGCMCLSSRRPRIRELQPGKRATWKCTNPQPQTKPNLVYCPITFCFLPPQKRCFCILSALTISH